MSKHLFVARGVVAFGALLAAALGCGLLEDVTAFTLTTKWYKVTIDTASLGLTIPGNTSIPPVDCSIGCGTANIKCSGQKYSCAFSCGAGNKCELVASIEDFIHVDISEELNKSQAGTKALSKASLSDAYYSTEEGNSLNFDTPKIEVFIAPHNATTSSAGVRFATLPPIKAGVALKPTPLQDITEAGSNALSSYVLQRVAFRFFIKASIKFPSGSPLPSGRLVFKVRALIKVTPVS